MKPVSTLYIGFKNQTHGSVYELPESADYRELITFSLVVIVATTNDLGVNVKAFGNGDNVISDLFTHVDLHAVTHVEHLVHLFPWGPRLFLNQLEQGRNGEHIILHDVHILHEIHHFGLGTTGAVYHAVNLFPVLVKHLLDYRDVRTGRRQYQFPGINAQSGNFVC